MKKKVSLIILTIFILSLFTAACTSEPQNTPIEFTEKTYARNEDYIRTFTSLYCEKGDVGIGFLDGLYSEDEAKLKATEIFEDVSVLKKQLDTDTSRPIEIYVLDDTVDGGSYAVGNKVFCTTDTLESGDYRIALSQAYSGTAEPWIAYGIYANAFLPKADESELAKYYANTDDLRMLDMFGARFYSDWNSTDELKTARDTAASLTAFILDRHGVQALLADAGTAVRQEWLNSIGVSREYHPAYDNEFNGFHYTHSRDYSLIITTDDARYNLNILEDSFKTSGDVEKFIHMDRDGRAYLVDYLRENAPRNFSNININPFLCYYVDEDNAGNHATGRGEIYLNTISANLHEAVHEMIANNGRDHWQFEGIGDYLSFGVYPYSYERVWLSTTCQDTMDKVQLGEVNLEDDEYLDLNYYFSHNGGYDTPEDVDLRLFSDASAYATLTNSSFGSVWQHEPLGDFNSISENDRIEGDDLSYAQAMSLTAYLIDNSSLDTFLDFCKAGADFETVFGMTFKEAKADWIAYLGRSSE